MHREPADAVRVSRCKKIRSLKRMIKRETKKEIGKYLIDVSKLIFAGMVLTSIIKIENVSKFS